MTGPMNDKRDATSFLGETESVRVTMTRFRASKRLSGASVDAVEASPALRLAAAVPDLALPAAAECAERCLAAADRRAASASDRCRGAHRESDAAEAEARYVRTATPRQHERRDAPPAAATSTRPCLPKHRVSCCRCYRLRRRTAFREPRAARPVSARCAAHCR